MAPVRDLLAEAQAAGELVLADPADTTLALMGAVAIVAMVRTAANTFDPDEIADWLIPQFLNGLCPADRLKSASRHSSEDTRGGLTTWKRGGRRMPSRVVCQITPAPSRRATAITRREERSPQSSRRDRHRARRERPGLLPARADSSCLYQGCRQSRDAGREPVARA